MYRYRCDIPNRFHIPDLIKQFLLGEYMVRILRQEGQKVKFLGGKGFLLTIDINTAGCFINLDTADLNNLIGFHTAAHQTFISGQMSFHTGYQLTRTERLCHIIISPQTQTTDLIDIFLLGRYHDDRRILLLTDLLADFETIHIRKHQIQNDQIKIFIQSRFESGITGMLHHHIKTAELQIILLKLCNCHFIFYNQNLTHIHYSPYTFLKQNTSSSRHPLY